MTSFSLITTDYGFRRGEAQHELITGIYDYMDVSDADLLGKVKQLHEAGAKTSNSLVVNETVQHADSAQAFIFAESKMGAQERLVDFFAGLSGQDVKGLYKTRGTHDIALAAEPGSLDQLCSLLSTNPFVRSFFAAQTEKPITIPASNGEAGPDGPNYRTALKEYDLSEKDIAEYAIACRDMAAALQAFDPTLVYSPVRGAKPMTDICLDGAGPLPVYYPVTASFVNGRKMNPFELQRLKHKHPGLCTRIAYIDELNSGGMIRGHAKEILRVFQEEIRQGDTKVKILGLANRYGGKIGKGVAKHFRRWNEQGMMEFFPINDLLTMDRRQILGLHFLDYRMGPHAVPFVNEDLGYHRDHELCYDIFAGISPGDYPGLQEAYSSKKQEFLQSRQLR
jgi:hypothetical protein